MFQALYDLTGCTTEPTAQALLDAMHQTVNLLGCTVHAIVPVTFVPHGTTAVIVLGESHLIVSTWPEHHTAHVDLFTCRADCDPDDAITPILAAFGTPNVHAQRVSRHAAATALSHGTQLA
ncbi:S-adenosylmethionine decarboxylase [Nocardia sp. BSTN01]|uniref:S-adenosylmethionine decarboxylase family protein n=1 Tax=Nocardia sp. BSTN01 TaxID=2783665 RepID=UPI001890AB8F|nr:S-adenosylmethionine decarboxylase [Nocardia sp. BSTN01]MBF5001836.1 S-adenosylmethionine decarboxylase [Nocardia sp. BSTN01]